MVHVHKPEHGPCGACGDAAGCPMVYCPTCPKGCLAAAAEGISEAFGLPVDQAMRGLEETRQRILTEQESPRPSLGRIVSVLVHPTLNNGSDVAPAVVTRVWQRAHDGSWLVNLRVFLDGTNHSHEWATSQHLYATEEQARKEWVELTERLDGFEAEHRVGVSGFAFWPARSS